MKEDVPDDSTPLLPTKTENDDPLEEDDGFYHPDFTVFESNRQRILFLVSVTAFLGPVSVTLFLPSIPQVIKDLDTTEAKVDLAVALYMFMLGSVPMLWSALSDRFGRKKTLVAGIGTHVITSILCGFSWNVEFLIFFRVLQAIGVSSLLVIGAGVVADIYPPDIRGNALGWFTMAPAVGPLFGPIIGGFITEFLGWRWIFWGSAILAAVFFGTTILLLPETLPRSYQHATPKRIEQDANWSWWEIISPFRLLVDPKVFFLSLANGLCQSTTVAVLVIFPITLESKFGLSAIYTGLCYLPYGVCALFGSTIGGKVCDVLAKNFGIGARLITTVTGVFNYALSGILFVYAVELPVILFATSLLGFFFCFQRPGVYSYLMQHYPGNSSGVSASILFVQYSLGFIGTSVGPLVWTTPAGKFWFFISFSIATFVATLPVSYLIYQKWGKFPGVH